MGAIDTLVAGQPFALRETAFPTASTDDGDGQVH
jgi:hypothetical protein